MRSQIVRHLTAAGGVADMPAAVMGYDAIAVTQEQQYLRVPVICRQRPPMAELDGLTLSPILVEDLTAVFGRNRGLAFSLTKFSYTHSRGKKSLHSPFVAMAQRSNAVTNVVARQSTRFLYFLRCNPRVVCSQSKIVW
jgi:hypothetical protein